MKISETEYHACEYMKRQETNHNFFATLNYFELHKTSFSSSEQFHSIADCLHKFNGKEKLSKMVDYSSTVEGGKSTVCPNISGISSQLAFFLASQYPPT